MRVHRKQTIHAAVIIVLFLIIVISGSVVFIGWKNKINNERRELLLLWEEGAYGEAYSLSRERLINKPMDFFLLTLHGFSAYQLAVAQINDYDTKTYIDESIWSLRKALLCTEGPEDFRIPYILGKAYYAKGSGYEDLAVKFLEAARDGNYQASDLPEFLGLAYASVHDYRNSVAAFSLALNAGTEGAYDGGSFPSDLLLLSIARSYVALDETESARAYLMRCLETSRDSKTTIAARLLLGEIFVKEENAEGAEAQYLTILKEDGENAEAHFQLGELYATIGDPTRARAEWRRAIRINPAHRPARQRLNNVN
ncbi:MAG: tetratricopeptide repeat protein [Treponema sp.]|nr:tetratricopeptide repeat protein [Treponema sp.]